MGYAEARGPLTYEKNLKSKFSCQTPFKLKMAFQILEWDDYYRLPETLTMDGRRLVALRDQVRTVLTVSYVLSNIILFFFLLSFVYHYFTFLLKMFCFLP